MAAAVRSHTVLVVDDDASIRSLLADVLRDEFGAGVAEARGPGEALAAARERRPCLVLLDVRLPRADGFDLCRLLHAEPGLADVPVVAVTAATPVGETRARALDAGCAEMVSKPFDVDDLVRVLERYLSTA